MMVTSKVLVATAAVALLAGLVNGCARDAATKEESFGKHWHDGKAELDGYQLKVSRYGQTRQARAAMVYVTEPFSESKRVKVDDPNKNPADTFDALKLNLIRDFQTGIYDYSTMVSTWVRTDNLDPVKVSFSSQEWCGNVYSQMVFRGDSVSGHCDSYFEGESGPIRLRHPSDGVPEDDLFILLRGLRGPFLKPGEQKTVDYLPGAFYTRLSHTPLAWTKATITRKKKTERVVVPRKAFECIVYTVDVVGGRQGVFYVEDEYPHRIVKWSLPPDVEGELLGSERLAYWKLHAEGDERYLQGLGLQPHR